MQVYIIEAIRKNCERHQKFYSKLRWEKCSAKGSVAESSTRYRKVRESNITIQVEKSACEGGRGRSLRLVTAKSPKTRLQIKLGKEDMRRCPEGDRKALWKHDVHPIQKSGYETVQRFSVKQTVFFCCAPLRFATALFFGASPHALLRAPPLDPVRDFVP